MGMLLGNMYVVSHLHFLYFLKKKKKKSLRILFFQNGLNDILEFIFKKLSKIVKSFVSLSLLRKIIILGAYIRFYFITHKICNMNSGTLAQFGHVFVLLAFIHTRDS